MEKPYSPDTRLLTRAEVARIFQVSPSTVTRWADAGKLPAIKTLGGHRRYRAQAVQELARCLVSARFNETEIISKKEVMMKKTILDVPTLYGDHHVIEVRRILLDLRGVKNVNASSCFHTVEVEYDPTETSAAEMKMLLNQAGYLDSLPVPSEPDTAVNRRTPDDGQRFFRHTTAVEQTRYTIGFAQDVNFTDRSLWPCPGMGVVRGTVLPEEVPHG